MDTADKIGLLPGFGWIAGHDFWVTLLICWMITPGLMLLLGPIGESRLVPVSPRRQYPSFFPGDFFLGAMAAGLLYRAQELPSEGRFYTNAWFHLVVLIVTLSVAVFVTYGEYNDPEGYGHRAVLSPTKLYHNILLYGCYGYVIIVLLVATAFSRSTWDSWLLVCFVPGVIWLLILITENNVPEAIKQSRRQYAHVNDWKPIWQRR